MFEKAVENILRDLVRLKVSHDVRKRTAVRVNGAVVSVWARAVVAYISLFTVSFLNGGVS